MAGKRVVVAVVCVPALIAGIWGVRRFVLARRAPPISRELVSTFASKDGDIVAHYPRELAAEAIDDSGVKLTASSGASVTLDEINPAMTTDLDVLARAALDAKRGPGISVAETSRTKATCHGQPAVLVDATVQEDTTSRKLHACVFVAADRSFSLAYVVPEGADESIFASVIDGAEIKSVVAAPKPAGSEAILYPVGDTMASCMSEETVCSSDAKNLVQCRSGKPMLILRPCLGPSGCTIVAGDPRCDETIARVGDPCDPAGRIACSDDGKSELMCASNKAAADPSPSAPTRPVPTYRGKPIYTPPPKPIAITVDKSMLVWGKARACKTACTVRDGRVQCD